jgi:hypothetical protein
MGEWLERHAALRHAAARVNPARIALDAEREGELHAAASSRAQGRAGAGSTPAPRFKMKDVID